MPPVNYGLHYSSKQLGILKSVVFCLIFLQAFRVRALVYAPITALRMQSAGNLSTALDLGRPGASFRSLAGSSETGGSAVAVHAAFPFLGSSDARLAGWSFGLAGGLSEASYAPNRIFWPGIYFWELSLGRGTTVPFFEKGSGLRGFMEVAFREERLRGSPLNVDALEASGITFPNRAFSTAIRIGAHSALEGDGIVQQKAPRPAFRLQSSVNFSHSDQPFYLSFDGKLQWRCHSDWVGCGVSALYIFAVKNQFAAASQELRHLISGGPTLSALFARRYLIEIHLGWLYTKGLRLDVPQTVTPSAPFVQTNFSLPF